MIYTSLKELTKKELISELQLLQIHFREPDFCGANIAHAIYDDKTVWPTGIGPLDGDTE